MEVSPEINAPPEASGGSVDVARTQGVSKEI